MICAEYDVCSRVGVKVDCFQHIKSSFATTNHSRLSPNEECDRDDYPVHAHRNIRKNVRVRGAVHGAKELQVIADAVEEEASNSFIESFTPG